ncbi:alpha-(1-_3)-arabinofuranosyltransferase [Bailinhaonella thermotolerans]|uniref:DUF3367 domain-containing protein n=1 Tax=Bailinhaonella thermotolerans TaxID=1070861 RepID=A0A3A4BGH2_9ACTN|nr:alpha-(1->3)-arabinofuranosyltransferase [Bailinhaonella thermotolerans]RJL30402.1 DUF3367 domain-containing protein [Bailinhaonella thermotolerans]
MTSDARLHPPPDPPYPAADPAADAAPPAEDQARRARRADAVRPGDPADAVRHEPGDPADGGAPPGSGGGAERIRHRLRLIAGCLFLGAVAFNTAPDRVMSETKLDMAVDPLRFMLRSLHLWNESFFGHLPNQAYGYLFPMGPFYLVGQWLGLPAWNTQRLWMSLVLCAAFLGVVQVARALGIGTPLTRVLGGLAYALAPHAQALVGINSSEFLPSAVLPWILLPLIKGTREGTSARRMALVSAAAFLFAGGINATAEIAVLGAPFLYLLTRKRGPRKRRLMAWWLGGIVAVSFWWLAPLLLMGRYIFSFLSYIETADVTTRVTSLTNILRGTSSWLSYLKMEGRDWVPAAYAQGTVPWLVVATALVAALGLAGLARRDLPERAFLALTLLAGVAIIATGHAGIIENPFAGQLRELLDGKLAALRNLHKFDALVRLPLALGLAAVAAHGLRRLSPRPRVRRPLGWAAAGLVAATLVPVASAGLTPHGSFWAVPGYWREATDWLNKNSGDGVVLVVPGSRHGEYQWGRPLDEPLQPLLRAGWATNTIVPWGSAGLSRLLKVIDQRISTGQGSAGLTHTLRRLGLRYIVVRNDLDRATVGIAWPARVHEALAESPGLRRVRGFGPVVGNQGSATAAGWRDQPYDSVEIYEVADVAPRVGTVPMDSALRVTGSPDALVTLAEQGVLVGDRPVLVGDEPGAERIPTKDTVITDSLRRREVSFSDLRNASSATMTEDQPYRTDRPARDLVDPAWRSATSTARFLGGVEVRASSSESEVDALPASRDPGRQPYAAMDGDDRTSWRTGGWTGPVGEWLEVRLREPVSAPDLRVAFERSGIGPPVSEVAVETDAGRRVVPVAATADPQTLPLPAGATRRVRITITKIADDSRETLGFRAGITELTIPGVRAERTIAVPGVPEDGAGAPTVVLSREDTISECMQGSYIWSCSPELGVLGEDGYGFNRTFVSESAGPRVLTGQAVLTDRAMAETFTNLENVYPKVTASSIVTQHPAVLGRAAFDDDPKTAWYAGLLDPRPTLTADLGRRTTVSRIRFRFPDSSLGAPPVKITVRTDEGVREGYPGEDGWLEFAPARTRKVQMEFTSAISRPIEVIDVQIPGVLPLPDLAGHPLTMPCGFGPTFRVDGRRVTTEIVGGTIDDLLNARPVTYRSCRPIDVIRGETRVSAAPGDPFRVTAAVVKPTGAAPVERVAAEPAEIRRWTVSERRVAVDTDVPSYLTINENYNEGWQAYLGGVRLKPVRLDGWRQAWELPEVTADVVLRYEPDRPYRVALAAGGGLALLVVLLALLPVRRGRDRPAAPAGHLRARWVWPLAPVLGFWIGGVIGAALTTAVFALVVWLRAVARAQHAATPLVWPARVVASPWVPAALAGAAGVLLALTGASAAAEVAPQALCLIALGHVAAATVREET